MEKPMPWRSTALAFWKCPSCGFTLLPGKRSLVGPSKMRDTAFFQIIRALALFLCLHSFRVTVGIPQNGLSCIEL